ncbi:MAG TPA: pyruvate ferredoxin oxidoreductase [Candidatus Binatia bacterium]
MFVFESGNVAAATGVRLARVQVIAAYPITPQTPLTEKLSEYVDSGSFDAEYVAVESEHSALAVCIGASSTSARTFTATSANGLLYMAEQLHWTAGARLPMVMCVVNRAVGAPFNIWNDHQDSISQRDTGWIQIYAKDHQEILDTVIKAYRLSEEVCIPVMVCYDGYYLSHTYMPYDVPDQVAVDAFLPPYEYRHTLGPNNPTSLNTVTLPGGRPDIHGEFAPGYMELRHNLHMEMKQAIDIYTRIDGEFAEIIGRGGNPIAEKHLCDDAEYVAVALGSMANQIKDVVVRLRDDGLKVGLLALSLYRPFPSEFLAAELADRKGVIVFEKALSFGHSGTVCADLQAALYPCASRPPVWNYILGLGGRSYQSADFYDAIRDCVERGSAKFDNPGWIGLGR